MKKNIFAQSLSHTNLWILFLTLSALITLSFSGCSKRFSNLPAFSSLPIYDSHNYSVGRFKTSYLAEQIHAYYRGHTNGPIAVATFVDIDNLYGSSTFGRFYADSLMSELTMLGYNVIELRQSEALQVMFGQGEFGLSREVNTLRNARDIGGLVVGTYAVSPVRVYVNARLVDPATSIVISAGSVEMNKTEEIARLLRSSTLPPSLERIPVRHLGYSTAPLPYYWPYTPPTAFGSRKYREESFYDEELPDSPMPQIQNPRKPPMPELRSEISKDTMR